MPRWDPLTSLDFWEPHKSLLEALKESPQPLSLPCANRQEPLALLVGIPLYLYDIISRRKYLSQQPLSIPVKIPNSQGHWNPWVPSFSALAPISSVPDNFSEATGISLILWLRPGPFLEAKLADSNGDFYLEAIILAVGLALASVFQDLVPSPWFPEPWALGRWPLAEARGAWAIFCNPKQGSGQPFYW